MEGYTTPGTDRTKQPIITSSGLDNLNPKGWELQRIGNVPILTKPPENLTFGELVDREVDDLIALGDHRSPDEVRTAVASEFEFRLSQYS